MPSSHADDPEDALPIAEYRLYLCDAQSAIEPYLMAWSQITDGRWIIRFRRRDGCERTISGAVDEPAGNMLRASRAVMHDLLAS